MKKIVAMFFITTAITVTKAQNNVIVDPNVSTRNLSGSFDKIKISGGFDLYLSEASTETIAVSAAEEQFKEKIKTEIENSTLHIYYEKEKSWGIKKNKKLKVYVSFKNLSKIDASGACDVIIAGNIKADNLNLKLSGASNFKGSVKVNSLNIDLSGASDVKISGTSTMVNIESSGASDVKAYDLITETCIAKASGASDISITVNKELSATANGASDIHYKGNAVIKNQNSKGASSVSKKG